MEKMEKPLSNSPFSPFYAMNFDHRITYVAAYLDTLTCLFSHNRLLKAHTKLLEAHTRLLEAKINSTILQGLPTTAFLILVMVMVPPLDLRF